MGMALRLPSAVPRYRALFGLALLSLLTGAARAAPAPKAAPRSLEALVAMARRDPRAAIARAAAAAAVARADAVDGARWLHLSTSAALAPSPSIRCVDRDCARTETKDPSLAVSGVFGSLDLAVVQPVYTFGKLGAASTAAHAAAAASADLATAAEERAVWDVAQAYYGFSLARDLLHTLDAGLRTLEEARKRVAASLSAGDGEATLQDQLRVDVLRARVEARRATLVGAADAALAALRAVTGDDTVEPDDAPLVPVADDIGAGADLLEARALEHRPELAAAQAAVRASHAVVGLEEARYLPDLVLAANLHVARASGVPDPASAFAADPFNTTTAAFGLLLSWSLDPFSQPARVRAAQADARRASAGAQAATALARLQLRRAWADARAARARVQATTTAARRARAWVTSTAQADIIDALDARDLADALVAWFSARAEQATAVHDWNLAVFRLHQLAPVPRSTSP